jgi:hypothetical protein
MAETDTTKAARGARRGGTKRRAGDRVRYTHRLKFYDFGRGERYWHIDAVNGETICEAHIAYGKHATMVRSVRRLLDAIKNGTVDVSELGEKKERKR